MGSHTIQHNIKIVEHPPSDYNNTEFKKPEIISQPSNNDDYYFTKNKNGLKKRSNSYERNDFPSRHDNYFHSRDNSQNFNQHRENYYHDRKLFPSQFSTLPRRVTSTGIPGPNPDYYPTKNFYDKGEFNSSYDVRNSHYQSQPLKSKDYSPKRHFDDFGFTESYNQNKDYGSYGRETGNVEESYDKQIKMSRSMSAIPTNGMRYRDNAYYYPQTDYSPLNSRIIRPFNRKFIEDGRTFNSNRQQSGPLPNYQYSNSGVGGGGQHYHSNSRYDNYHESFYGTKNNEQMKYDQQSLPYGSPNMMVTSQHDRNKQLSSKSAKIGSRHSKSQSIKRQNRWTSSGTAANSGYFDKNAIIGYDKDGKPIRRQNHYKVNCCCFTFKWPLWTVEPCPPPQRMYGPSNFEHNQNMNVHENFKDNNVQSYPRQSYN